VLTTTERKLFENFIDSLDRLYDKDCGSVDVFAILFATTHALRDTPHYAPLDKSLQEIW